MYSTKQNDITGLKEALASRQERLSQDVDELQKKCSWTTSKQYRQWFLTGVLFTMGLILWSSSQRVASFVAEKAGYINANFYGYTTVVSLNMKILLCVAIYHWLFSAVLFFRILIKRPSMALLSEAFLLEKKLKKATSSVDKMADELEGKLQKKQTVSLSVRSLENQSYYGAFAEIDKLHQRIPQMKSSDRLDTVSIVLGLIYAVVVLLSIIYLAVMLFILPHCHKILDYHALRYGKNGDIVLLGRYEQDRNDMNGKEPIRWILLQKENERALLLSEKILDKKPYYTTYTDITWEYSSIRKWLNNEFVNMAFSETERRYILISRLRNTDYIKREFFFKDDQLYRREPKPYEAVERAETIDQVFLLSYDEAKQLSSLKAESTEYANYQLFYYRLNKWILRSAIRIDPDSFTAQINRDYGDYRAVFAVVHKGLSWYLNDNDTLLSVNDDAQSGIRPAIWVRLPNE